MAISLQFLYLDHSKTYLEGPPLLSANHGLYRQVASQESWTKKLYCDCFTKKGDYLLYDRSLKTGFTL